MRVDRGSNVLGRLKNRVASLQLGTIASTRASRRCRVRRDITYSQAHGLAMDVYQPVSRDGLVAGIVLFHGGGFVGGTRRALEHIGRAMAGAGYVAFSVDYRLMSGIASIEDFVAGYRDSIQDAEEAMRYVRDNAVGFGVDPARIGVFGTSAGANLAAVVGWRRAGGSTADRVGAVVSWSGPLELFTATADVPPAVRAAWPELSHERYGVWLSENRSTLAKASPVDLISEGVPPTLIVTSRADLVPVEVAQRAARRLAEVSTPHELVVLATGHGRSYASEALGTTLDFLRRHIPPAPP
jgi:acetyl esterase